MKGGTSDVSGPRGTVRHMLTGCMWLLKSELAKCNGKLIPQPRGLLQELRPRAAAAPAGRCGACRPTGCSGEAWRHSYLVTERIRTERVSQGTCGAAVSMLSQHRTLSAGRQDLSISVVGRDQCAQQNCRLRVQTAELNRLVPDKGPFLRHWTDEQPGHTRLPGPFGKNGHRRLRRLAALPGPPLPTASFHPSEFSNQGRNLRSMVLDPETARKHCLPKSLSVISQGERRLYFQFHSFCSGEP